MENQEEKAAKNGGELFWRKCPICGQESKDFLPLMKHIEEHPRYESQLGKLELGAKDYLSKKIAQEFSPFIQGPKPARKRGLLQPPGRASKRKFAEQAKGLLPVVADWLEQALMTLPDINTILTSDVKVAEQLVGFARRLPDSFREQRDYLLKRQERLKETGMDSKWPRKAGSQIRFIAESMAGAEWDLTPSTSREFIRQKKPRKGAIPAAPQRWWDPDSRAIGPGTEGE